MSSSRAGRRRPSSAIRVVALLAALGLVGAACSGGDDGTAQATTTTAGALAALEADLLHAATALNQALVDPAATAEDAAAIRGLLVAGCRDQWDQDQLQGLLVDWVDQRRVDYGPVAEELTVGQISADGVHTDHGDVLVRWVTPTDDDPTGWGVPMRQEWVVEDGAWRYDLCNSVFTVDGATDVYTPVRVVASGMHEIAGDDDGRFAQNWAVVVTNPNPDGAAYDVAVTVRFLDEAGDELRIVQANILDIEPGQTGAAADVADAPGAVRMEVTARAGSWAPTDSGWTLTGSVDERTAEEPMVAGSQATTHVVGSVTNTSDADLGAVPVVVFLDQSGRVVGGLANALMKGVVPPAATERFSMLFPGPIPAEWSTKVYVTPAAPDYEYLSDPADLTGDVTG